MSHRVKVNDVIIFISRYIAFKTVILIIRFLHNTPGHLLTAYLANGLSPFPCNSCEAAVLKTYANSLASASSMRLIEMALQFG